MKELIKMLKEDSVLDFNTRFKKLLEYKLYCETLNESMYDAEEIAEFYANDENEEDVKAFLAVKGNPIEVYQELKDRDFDEDIIRKFAKEYSIKENFNLKEELSHNDTIIEALEEFSRENSKLGRIVVTSFLDAVNVNYRVDGTTLQITPKSNDADRLVNFINSIKTKHYVSTVARDAGLENVKDIYAVIDALDDFIEYM